MKAENATPEMLAGMQEHAAAQSVVANQETPAATPQALNIAAASPATSAIVQNKINEVTTGKPEMKSGILLAGAVIAAVPEIWKDVEQLYSDAKNGDSTAASKIEAIVNDVIQLLQLASKIAISYV